MNDTIDRSVNAIPQVLKQVKTFLVITMMIMMVQKIQDKPTFFNNLILEPSLLEKSPKTITPLIFPFYEKTNPTNNDFASVKLPGTFIGTSQVYLSVTPNFLFYLPRKKIT